MVNVKFNSKKVIAIFAILLLLFGGAGGYLLWRINQEQTVAPTDSDAARIPDCPTAAIKIIYGGASTKEGTLETFEGKEAGEPKRKVNRDYESGNFNETLETTCAVGSKIKAIPRTGYKFLYWQETKTKRKFSGDVLEVKAQELGSGVSFTFNPVYEVDSETGCLDRIVEVTYGSLVDKDEQGNQRGRVYLISSRGNDIKKEEDNSWYRETLRNSCDVGSQLKAEAAEGYKFAYWEVVETKKRYSTDPVIDGVKASDYSKKVSFKAVYEKDTSYKGNKFFLRYAASTGGYITADGVRVDDKIQIDFEQGKEYPKVPVIEAIADAGYEFDKWEMVDKSPLEGSDWNPRNVEGKMDDKKQVTLIMDATFKKKETPKETFQLRYSTEGNGKLSKDGGTPSSNTISVTVKEGESGPSVKAEPNTGYEFAYWIDNTTKKKDTSSLASTNPRQDTNVKGNISLTAHYEKSGGTTPPDDGDTKPPSTGDTDKDDLPGTAASPEGSLYIIVVGTLILSMGMLLPYLPAKINIKRKER